MSAVIARLGLTPVISMAGFRPPPDGGTRQCPPIARRRQWGSLLVVPRSTRYAAIEPPPGCHYRHARPCRQFCEYRRADNLCGWRFADCQRTTLRHCIARQESIISNTCCPRSRKVFGDAGGIGGAPAFAAATSAGRRSPPNARDRREGREYFR